MSKKISDQYSYPHKPSIHGVCQCLDLLMINVLCSSSHSLQDTVQRGVQGPQVLNGAFQSPLDLFFWPILPEEEKLPKNYAHISIKW